MSWSAYVAFLGFAVLLVLVPGPDFAVVTRNTLAGGHGRGSWSAFGVTCSNAVQGGAAAAGLGALLVHAQPVFQAIKWAGIAYLVFLAAQALRAAVRGDYPSTSDVEAVSGVDRRGVAFAGWRQGFLSNITNPKVLVFYLAVLPQFLAPGSGTVVLLVFALSHALLSLLYLLTLVRVLHRARAFLARRRVRRTLDTATGVALLAFGTKLALD